MEKEYITFEIFTIFQLVIWSNFRIKSNRIRIETRRRLIKMETKIVIAWNCVLIGRGKRMKMIWRLSSSDERRWIRVCGKGEVAWNFKHDAHNGLGHVLVYLVMIPTDEVQLLGNSTTLRALLPGMLVHVLHGCRERNCAPISKLIIEIGNEMERTLMETDTPPFQDALEVGY